MVSFNLKDKSILIIGVYDKLSKIIAGSIIESGADVTLIGSDKVLLAENFVDIEERQILEFDITDCSSIESRLKSDLPGDLKFDGIVFCNTRSDFRPLSFVNHDNLASIMNDNYFSFVEFMCVLFKMKKINTNACVVVLSSIISIRAMKAKMAFCSSKAALDAAVKCLAVEFSNKKIRINSIQKGEVDVDFEKTNIQDVVSIRAENSTKSFLGISSANEISNIVMFLLSDATQTLTGQSIVIDGGYTL